MKHHVPAPTVWPAALATGVTFAAAGLVTSPVLIAFGAVVAVVALVGWVSILVREDAEP
ncbi:MAG TPA: hypothetical protein VFC31_11205 [Candidatus Limnocylindria bacterium]|nr:hypothetical protein [Candidatus Limnocylindria bacterium]